MKFLARGAIGILLSLANMAAAQGVESPDETQAMLIEMTDEMMLRCSGPEGQQRGSDVCEQSEELQRMVNRSGWCLGKKGEAPNLAQWHKCTKRSNRMK